jgi:hypothetical protein
MEPLEFGDMLMRRHPRLKALAALLADDEQRAGPAVRLALADTWRARDLLVSEVEMDRFLYTHLRCALGPRTPRPLGALDPMPV